MAQVYSEPMQTTKETASLKRTGAIRSVMTDKRAVLCLFTQLSAIPRLGVAKSHLKRHADDAGC